MATINGFNVGTDLSFTVTDSLGDVFIDGDLALLTEFESESEDQELKYVPITTGGVPIYQTLWSGIRGHMMFARFGNAFTQLFIDLQNAYYVNGIIPQFQMLVSVRNRDSSIDEYLYTGMQFNRPRFGTFRATREVDLRVEFKAATIQTTGAEAAFLAGVAALAA